MRTVQGAVCGMNDSSSVIVVFSPQVQPRHGLLVLEASSFLHAHFGYRCIQTNLWISVPNKVVLK